MAVSYFDLDTDYGYKEHFARTQASEVYRCVSISIRILNQDYWRFCISFIVSQNIPRD